MERQFAQAGKKARTSGKRWHYAVLKMHRESSKKEDIPNFPIKPFPPKSHRIKALIGPLLFSSAECAKRSLNWLYPGQFLKLGQWVCDNGKCCPLKTNLMDFACHLLLGGNHELVQAWSIRLSDFIFRPVSPTLARNQTLRTPPFVLNIGFSQSFT